MSTIRYVYKNNKLEILVNAKTAFDYKYKKNKDCTNIFVSDYIYSDSKKGIRFPIGKLETIFKTKNLDTIKKIILENGELNLTTDQRHMMKEQRKKQIIEFISKTFIDPKSNLPHPPLRIEQAINDAKISIDPYKNIQDQIKNITDKIRLNLPLKPSSKMKLLITISNQYASRSYSVLKSMGKLIRCDYQTDGSLKAIVEIQAALKPVMIDKLNIITKNNALVEVIADG
ncbi:MAG: ribosome assembly factor SBDS [Nitrosopumilaceae archaeon]|nr:ribosome assembly factor SBDS [Nitrosopumilaceae archaeon]